MGTLKLVLGLAVVIAVIYGLWLLVPPYFSNYQFEDMIKTEALHDTYSTKTDDDVRKAVLKQAKDFEISLTEEQVKVQRTGMQGTGTLSIDVDYTVHVDMPGYPLDLHFHPSSKNRGVW